MHYGEKKKKGNTFCQYYKTFQNIPSCAYLVAATESEFEILTIYRSKKYIAGVFF